MHSIDFVEFDDHIYMLSWDDSEPEPIVSDEIYEMSEVTLGPRMPVPFRLVPEAASAPYVDDVHTSDVQYIICGVEWYDSSPPQPLDHWRRSHPRRSYIRVETTTTLEGLIHMVMAGRRVSFVLLDNGSTSNVCPLATTIALGYAPSDFGPSTQTVRAYDSTWREVMSTLEIELLIGSTAFVVVFQVLRIPASFNLLLGRPCIHKARAIISSLHQKISHSDNDLLLTRFTFDEHGPSEFMAFPDHDVPFGFDSFPLRSIVDIWRDCARKGHRSHMHHRRYHWGLSTTQRPSFNASSSSSINDGALALDFCIDRPSISRSPEPYDICFPDELMNTGHLPRSET
ncbi:hypothetical protein CK203_025417 [Vitis vinifera]|uniref:Uncharacterized protein n=1 Tax=Vitis vinifera TaxID=29760 RepID=A0A438IZT0_VITVI|nr:hypothetical protein CK203_025417 [Vitis vinifera]